eukprot:1097310-Alexandrium_andersonii.AAC.1
MEAPVCSTWINLNMGTSGRSDALPLGRIYHKSVAAANMMVSRIVLLLVILTAKDVWWITEQPRGSRLEKHPRWQWLVRWMLGNGRRMYKYSFYMCDHGADTRKPSW